MGEFLKKENEKQVKNIERLVEKAEIKQDIEKNSYKKFKQVKIFLNYKYFILKVKIFNQIYFYLIIFLILIKYISNNIFK